MSMPHALLHRRHVSRKLALQAIYQWQITQHSINELFTQFREDMDFPKADVAFFEDLVVGVVNQVDALDALIKPHIAIEIPNIDMIERAILRIAVHELQQNLDTPFRVVLSEAVTLARQFGAEEGYKFINGVLDKVAAKLRPLEQQARA